MKSCEWDERYHKLINYLNANPHIAATYPFMETVPNDMREIILDLSACEEKVRQAEQNHAVLVKKCKRALSWNDFNDTSCSRSEDVVRMLRVAIEEEVKR